MSRSKSDRHIEDRVPTRRRWGSRPPADDDRRQQEQDAPEAFALAKGRSNIQPIRETEVDVRDSCHGMEGWSQSVDSRPIVSTEWFEIILTDWAGWIAMIQSGMLSEGEGKRSRDPSPQNLGVGGWLAAVWRVSPSAFHRVQVTRNIGFF
ncbi:hypothetical protein K438DRAFT_1768728 [Mycena galopus ATCC 62051]|nr:hypothetical protein K438DRAFT_1768728 [Mycena galopus ATCC 62051]